MLLCSTIFFVLLFLFLLLRKNEAAWNAFERVGVKSNDTKLSAKRLPKTEPLFDFYKKAGK